MICANEFCGHSYSRHEGDESGMGGAEPCMIEGCECGDFTRKAPDSAVSALPPLPVFQAPSSFYCGMNEEE